MAITVEAIYESGVFKPLKPVDALQEHERVRITVQRIGVVAEQRRDRINLDQAVAHEIAETPEPEVLAAIRAASKQVGADKISMREIDKEIAAYRREREV